MANVREWMVDKTILLTGGAGFFGKVLTEKLLRSCEGVKRIYLIIRPKFGKDPKERWSEIAKDKLFEKVLTEHPNIMEEKVVVLNGDMSLINFGLDEEILEELQEQVDIIFHSAATVRFNDPLHKAFLANTRGTLELCKLASKMKNLECFLHVSTTYCNHNLKQTFYEEKIYEPCQDWRTVLKLVETESPETINTISYKIIQDHPNTYTFSKSLSEKIMEEYSDRLPVVIVRPSVVLGIHRDPLPGWTDNLNGLMGVTTGVCKGVMRVIKGRIDCALDYIQVDLAINAMIIAAWEKVKSKDKTLALYNTAYGNFSVDFHYIANKGLEINKIIALDNDIWYSFVLFAQNDYYFHFLFYLLQVMPAAFMDLILFLLNKKPMLIKLNIKIYQACQALAAFTSQDIKFENTKFQELWDKMAEGDNDEFYLKPPSSLNIDELITNLHYGVKVYYFKEEMKDNEYHRLKQRRFYYLDRVTRALLICGVFILLYKIIIKKYFM